MQLPDVNVWLAIAFDSHVHHLAAKAWFDARTNDAAIFFCRMTQQGFLRLASNASVFGSHALTLAEAWKQYDVFLSDVCVSFAGEPSQIESHWRSFTQRQSFSPKVWNDAFLAAFALTANLELVSFDKGFSQYPNVRCTILT